MGIAGFTAVPNTLIRLQRELGLSSTELVVLLNILCHWWRAEEWPFPRMTTIAKRMGVNRRTVERAVYSLQKKGLLTHQAKELPRSGGPQVRRFDLTGLIQALQSHH